MACIAAVASGLVLVVSQAYPDAGSIIARIFLVKTGVVGFLAFAFAVCIAVDAFG